MTLTVNKAEEAAGSKPCRLHPTWFPRADSNTNTTTTTKRQQIQQLLPIKTSPVHFSNVENVSLTSTCTQTDSQDITSTGGFSVSVGTQTEAEDQQTEDYNDTKPRPPQVVRILKEFASDAETLTVRMPVGTNFENSALKASFSLSSLQPSTGLEGVEQPNTRTKNERLYHSLTKKRKDPKQDSWRRSWGSACENKDDFWQALQANYDYIMDNHLIDSCQETDSSCQDADNDGSMDDCTWTLSQLVTHFSDLYSFLNDIQEAVYGKTENVTNWTLRASYMEEMTRVSSRRKLFNDQAGRLRHEVPTLQDEITWRVHHLNSKWEQVENALSSTGCSRCEQDSCPDVEHEVRCLRKWVKEMESRLQPLNFQIEWTLPELEKKALEHMVLQRDIENHSKIVSSVVRLCNRAVPRDAKCHASNAKRVASGLERRYHLLFLRSLEWQCHIESLVKLHNTRYQDLSSDCDSDEEPCIKQPRLSCDYHGYDSSLSHSEDEDRMSYTDCETDFGSESVSIIKMVNDNGNGTGLSDGSDADREGFKNDKLEETYEPASGNEPESPKHKTNEHESRNETAHITPKEKSCTAKERNTLHKLTVAVDLPGESNGTIANVGSYYFKHRDTDSELDTMDSIKSVELQREELKAREESTEDEFTYQPGNERDLEIGSGIETERNPSKESIKLLVQRADELVATPSRVDPFMFQTENQKHKLSRVKEWLNFEENEKPSDSCDASGECTSGDSEEDKESQSSEDLNESVITCRPQALNDSRTLNLDHSNSNLTSELLQITDVASCPDSVKVSLRPKRLPMKGSRPWSVSCLSQLSQSSPTKSPSDALPNFSISESALNKLSTMSPAASANSIAVHGHSTSSTVEETILLVHEGSRPVSVRKKKMRLRRKHIGRKTESGSESQSQRSPVNTSALPSPCKAVGPGPGSSPGTLVKSGSFSGCSSRLVYQERATASDPASRPHTRGKIKGDTSTTSGADSEDDKKIQRLPHFMLGPRIGIVKGYCTALKDGLDRDSSPEKSGNSLTTAEEHSSSLSEQAWDNYQDKYLSENYSEAHDSDAARRLLEFGEDYRSFLDSQSDCWSGASVKQEFSPQLKRKPPPLPFADSDSEIEDVKHLINESKAQLAYTLEVYKKHLAMGLGEFLLSSDCGEIIATCERHIYGLEVIIDANDDTKVLPDIEVIEVKALMSAWMDLKWSAKKMQSSRALHNEIIAFKQDLSQYAVNSNPTQVEVKCKEELALEIERLTEIQNVLQDKKRRLLELNVAVHRYIVSEDTPGYSNLRSEVSELYTLWNDTCQSVTDRLASLNMHLQIWAQLESRLDELQSDLRSDEETLQLLDTALKGGYVSVEVASSVRDVAKVLSESQEAAQKCLGGTGTGTGVAAAAAAVAAATTNEDVFNGGIRSLSLSLLTEGSYSDSGISDEGSEQELSEREHRLAAIRRLVRQLEAIMAPDSEARLKMTQRMEQAESELKKLQSQCRGLIVRTAVCAEVQSRGPGSSTPGCVSGSKSASTSKKGKRSLVPAPDPDCDPDDSGSWFWRVMKASMPFQVAIVALICVACLLEPSCCDSINNLNLSLTPQLRYVRGPPPV